MNLLFQRLKKAPVSGQIILFVILFMAVLVVFIAVMMNLGRLAQVRTMVSNATDMASLAMASIPASISHYIWVEGLDCAGGFEKCIKVFDWLEFLFNIFYAIVIGLMTGGWGTWIAIGCGLLTFGLEMWDMTINIKKRGDALNAVNKMFAGMSDVDRLAETGISGVLGSLAMDLIAEPDYHDLDMDGMVGTGYDADGNIIGDQTNRFGRLYAERVQKKLDGYAGSQETLEKLLYEPYLQPCTMDLAACKYRPECLTPPKVPCCCEDASFRDHWQQFACFLGGGLPERTITIPGTSITVNYHTPAAGCMPCADPDFGETCEANNNGNIDDYSDPTALADNIATASFLHYLGEDKGNLSASTGVYKLLYTVTAKESAGGWGYYGTTTNPKPILPGWKGGYLPCTFVTTQCQNIKYYYCMDKDTLKWNCMSTKPAENDGIDNLRQSVFEFIAPFSSKFLFGKTDCNEQGCRTTTPEDEMHGTVSFQYWFGIMDRDWYNRLADWQDETINLDILFDNIANWIDSKINGCAGDQACLDKWNPRKEVIFLYGTKANDLKKTNEFNTARARFAEGEERLKSYLGKYTGGRSSARYSWKDNLGWHHVSVIVDFTELPRADNFMKGKILWWDEYNCNTLLPRDWWNPEPGHKRTEFGPGRGWGSVTAVYYDQDKANTMSFASGKPIWRFKFTHPDVKLKSTENADQVFNPPYLVNCGAGLISDDRLAGFDCAEANRPLEFGIKSKSCFVWGPDAHQTRLVKCPK